MEGKWIAVISIGVCLGMFGPIAVTEYAKYQCRIEGIKAKIDSESIIKICSK